MNNLLGIPGALEETKKRLACYEKAGIDGFFVPCIEKREDIEAIVQAAPVPVNVMCMPNLPNFETLAELDVKRISMGNFLFGHIHAKLENTLTSILETKSFKPVF